MVEEKQKSLDEGEKQFGMRDSEDIQKDILDYNHMGQEQLTNELLLDIRHLLFHMQHSEINLRGEKHGK